MNTTETIHYLNTLHESKTPCVFIIDFSTHESYVWEIDTIPDDVLISFPSFTNSKKNNTNTKISIDKKPILFDIYKNSFSKVQKHLQQGNSFLINLTCESEITSNATLLEIFHESIAPYSLYFKNKFVVFSPEPFITIKENRIQTYPMKGTIDASIENAEKAILQNKKEQAEHATIVDLLRNDISIVATQVKVESYRYIDKIQTNTGALLQVSSSISGVIKNEFQNKLGNLLFKLLPAGSISGAPKPKTLEIIQEVETHSRGFYTGIMGYFDGANLESAVMIRYIEQRNNLLYYKSGGGITTQSNLIDEYEELIQKIYVPTL